MDFGFSLLNQAKYLLKMLSLIYLLIDRVSCPNDFLYDLEDTFKKVYSTTSGNTHYDITTF